jgi:UDP-N-acetylmuramyl pentapeptide phosphotransferase/UDP-N-acetylglucosamine-1-phosphate transferase
LRGGGIIFYFGALVYFLTNHWEYPWFMVALTLITFISFVDDIRSTSQGLRLVFHFSAMALMFYQWGLFSLSWWWIIVALVICTGYINSEITTFVESALINTVLCSVLVFCFFNFRKKAKCFAGDVGSVSIAFILLFLIGKLILMTGDFSWIILLSVYGVDSVLTIIHRLMLHENIGLPHRKHMYQLMANELKMPHVVVALTYKVAQAVIIMGYISCQSYGYTFLLCMVLLLGIVYICFMKKFFALHQPV